MSTKYVLKLIIAFMLFCAATTAQNLVPNPSFAPLLDSCAVYADIDYSQLEIAPPWIQGNAGTSDAFNECPAPNRSHPNNAIGYQIARRGTSYGGFVLYAGSGSHEYVQSPLSDSLKSGQRYCITFYVSLSDKSRLATDRIGAYLSTDTMKGPDQLHLAVVPQIGNPRDSIISDKENWTVVRGEFVASGGERFITIGNFYSDDSTSFINVGGTTNWAYYYIDDVSVVLGDCSTGIIDFGNDPDKMDIYPNPVTTHATIALSGTASQKPISSMRIYNMSGQLMRQQEGIRGQVIYLDRGNLPNGIYIVEVTQGEKVYRKKLATQ